MSDYSGRRNKEELETWSESDLELGDTFDINPYEYFLVTEISETSSSGFIRDGIHVIGEQESASFDLEYVISQINSDEWSYVGNNSQLIPDEDDE